MKRLGRWFPILVLTILVGLQALAVSPAQAFNIDTGNSDFKLRWDNTLNYSAAFRVSKQSEALTDPAANPSNANQDDGDRNFGKGLISNRLSLFSELDAVYRDAFGVRLSGSGWYDTVYNTGNDNNSPYTVNSFSVGSDEFTDDTRDLHGRDAELLDAFVFGSIDTESTTTSVRIGQFAQQWGESLFFGNNGIAGGMAPVDVVKLLSVPSSQFKEIIRPVPQLGVQVQLGSRVSLGGYYQFGWDPTVLPAAGSYFSTSDTVDQGAERLFIDDHGDAFYRGQDMDASDSGQWGVQARVRPGMELDLGFYALRYHDKTPQLYVIPGVDPLAGVINPGVFDPTIGKFGEYILVYPEDIEVYGLSASKSFGDWNLATEISMRRNMPLVSIAEPIIPAFGLNPDNSSHPAYAVGRTLHANFSWLASFGPNFLANESSFLGEVAWNRLDKISKNSDALDPNTEKNALGIRVMYEPSYRQVLSGLDLSVPLGLSYFPQGKSAVVSSFGPDKGGDMSIGLTAVYLDVWRIKTSLTHYYGSEAGFLDPAQHQSMKQSLGDRDFVSLSISRTF
jgi:hypothetical protein